MREYDGGRGGRVYRTGHGRGNTSEWDRAETGSVTIKTQTSEPVPLIWGNDTGIWDFHMFSFPVGYKLSFTISISSCIWALFYMFSFTIFISLHIWSLFWMVMSEPKYQIGSSFDSMIDKKSDIIRHCSRCVVRVVIQIQTLSK